MPRVSVILPNYNYARYLKERVRSILNQTMTDFELIYVDDASTDASNRVMEPFAADARVRMVLHTQNSGRVYQRWREAAELATGEWLWFAGADDTAHPQFLEKLLALAQAHPSAAILHANCAIIGTDGRFAKSDYTNLKNEKRLSSDYFAFGYEDAVRLTQEMFLFTASSMLLRQDAYRSNRGWDSRLWLCADWDLYLNILRQHDIAHCAERLVCFRLHTKNVSRTTQYIVTRMEYAYSIAHAYTWMLNDPRCIPEMRTTVLRCLRVLVREVFADPSAQIPEKLRFASEEIYRHIPDRRLLNISASR